MEVHQLLLSFLVFMIFLSFLIRSRQPTPNLPPGPWKLPLIGNLHNLTGALPHRALHRLALKYGPLMHLKLGELSVVVVSSAQVAELVMKTHDLDFASRPSIASSAIISYGNTDVATAPYGEYWRQVKKICVLELLTRKRVQSFRFIREEFLTGLMDWIATNEGSPVNVSEKLSSVTYEITTKATLGTSVGNENDLLIPILRGIVQLISGFCITDLFPSIGLLQRLSTSGQRINRYHHELDIILEKIIQEHRVANGGGEEKGKHDEYMVDILLKHQEKGSEFHLSTDNIKAVIVDVFLAGVDTSSTTAIWAMAEMMKNPQILDKAQQEVRQVFDTKGYVDESDIDQLKYLKCVIKEAMRLHPPIPLLLPRKCIQTCEINGYKIPAKTQVIVNAWAINNDPLSWKEPACFLPERFIDSAVDYKGNNFEYIPFGAGRRMCPAIAFGLANVQLPLAMLLYYFDWTLPAGIKPEDMDMSEAMGISVGLKEPLNIIPLIRRALPHSNK